MNNLVVHKNHTDFVPGTGNVTARWEGRTSEVNGGIRKYWGGKSTMRPILAAALRLSVRGWKHKRGALIMFGTLITVWDYGLTAVSSGL